jgi:hypothetical protein
MKKIKILGPMPAHDLESIINTFLDTVKNDVSINFATDNGFYSVLIQYDE